MASFTHPQARDTKSHHAGHTRQPALPSASSYAGYRSLGNPLESDLPSIKHTPICEVFPIASYGRTMKVASPGRWDFHINPSSLQIHILPRVCSQHRDPQFHKHYAIPSVPGIFLSTFVVHRRGLVTYLCSMWWGLIATRRESWPMGQSLVWLNYIIS